MSTRFLALGIVALLLLAVPAAADYYRYRDDRGSLCFANHLDLIPAKFRARAELVVEATPPPSPAPALNPYLAVQPPTDVQPVVSTPVAAPLLVPLPVAAAPGGNPSPWRESRVRVAAIAVGFLAVSASIALLVPSLMPKQLARVIYLSCFLGVFTLGLKLYSGYMVDAYFTIKAQALKIFAKANERSQTIETSTE